MKITTLDGVTLKVLRDGLQKAVDTVAKAHGVSIRVGSCSYSEENATYTNGQAKTRTVTDFEKYANLFNLKAADLGRKINFAGQQYEIVGLKVRSRRFPLLAKRLLDGKTFKLPITAARG